MALRDLASLRVRIVADTRGVDKGLKSAETSVSRFKTSYVAATAAIAAATAAVVKGFQQLREGATLAAQEQALRTQLARVGQDLEGFLGTLDRVAKGTLSTAEQIQASSSALLLGIPADKISELLEIARKSAAATGQEIGQAFNDIATGIGRASPLILDNLGITVKLGEANRIYAEQLGKSVDALTEAERKQALLNAVLETGATQFAGLENAITPAADAMDRFVSSVTNVGDDLAKAGGSSNILANALDFLNARLFQDLEAWKALNPEVAEQVELYTELDKLLKSQEAEREKEIQFIASLGPSYDTLNDAIGDQVNAYDLLTASQERYLRLTAQAAEETEAYEKILKSLGIATDVDLNEKLVALNLALETNARLYAEGAISAEQYDRAQTKLGTEIEDVNAALENETEQLEAQRRAAELSTRATSDLGDASEDAAAKIDEVGDAARRTRAELNATTTAAQLTSAAFDQIARSQGRAAAEAAARESGVTVQGGRFQFRGGSRLVRTNAGVQQGGGFFGSTGELRSPIFDEDDRR